MNFQIRKAIPADGPFLARSILIAGRAHVKKGIWEIILNTPESETLRFLEQVTITPLPHLFHYTCSLVAEINGIPAGSLGGYNPEVSGYQELQTALPGVYRKLGLTANSFRDASERAARILACLPAGPDNAWIIDSVATMPEFRGRGIAENLLLNILDEGRRQNHTVSQVNMYIGNEPALRLYKKMGYKVSEERRDSYFEEKIGSPGMLSLSRSL